MKHALSFLNFMHFIQRTHKNTILFIREIYIYLREIIFFIHYLTFILKAEQANLPTLDSFTGI